VNSYSTEGMEKHVNDLIAKAERTLLDSFKPVRLEGLNGFQRKMVHQHFEATHEFIVKSYKEDDNVILKVYPVGKLKRLAEEKTQEALMNSKAVELPSMGSFERFVIHEYLQERNGIKTESTGERGKDRRVVIKPLFGRSPRRVTKRR